MHLGDNECVQNRMANLKGEDLVENIGQDGMRISERLRFRACGMRWFTYGLVTCSCVQVTHLSFRSFAYDGP